MFAMKCCPPAHKLSPEGISNLMFIHHDRLQSEDYELIANTLEGMNKSDFEHSRSLIAFGLEHIIETINGIYYNIDALSVASSTISSFSQNFKRINDPIKKLFPKNEIKEKEVNTLIFWLEIHSEGIQLLEYVYNHNPMPEIFSLLEEERLNNNLYFDELAVRQSSLAILKPDYVITTPEQINSKARKNIEDCINLRYDNLGYKLLNRLSIDEDCKMFLWSITVNDEKRKKCIEDKIYTELEEEDYLLFKEKLPKVFREYSQIFNVSFTNNMHLMACVAKFRAEYIAENGSLLRNSKHKIYQLDNEFADKLMVGSSKIKEILYNIQSPISEDNSIIIYKDKQIDKYIAKLKNSQNSIIFYEEKDQTFGCVISNEDLKNNKILSFKDALEHSKGSSFHGMTHFMIEIQDEWVQNYYFDNIIEALPVYDTRSLVELSDSRHLYKDDDEDEDIFDEEYS